MNISVKRLSVFLLALLMLLCAAACGKKPGTEDGSDVASGTNGDNAAQTDPEGDGTPDLPENMNLDRTVNILVRSEFKDEFVPDDKTADVLSAAIFARNSAVSETLGVKLNFTDIACDEFTGPYGGSPFHAAIVKVMSAGSDTYQIIANFAYFSVSYIQQGYFLELNTLANSYLDISKPYWNSNYYSEAALNGKNYYLLGDICTTAMTEAEVIYYNETLVKNYLGEDVDLLQKVYDKEWTYNYLLDCIAAVGNGEETGVWGMSATNSSYSVDGFLAGLGLTLVKTSPDAQPQVTVTDSHNIDITNALRKLYHSNSSMYVAEAGEPFRKGQSMFYADYMKYAQYLTNEKISYGMLPFPLWDENQDDYYPTSHDAYTVLGIPRTCEKPEEITAVLELMAYESRQQVRPALYYKCYSLRYLGTNEKAMMFDFIIDKLSYNFGYIYSDVLKNPSDSLGAMHIFRYDVVQNKNDLMTQVYGQAGVYKQNLKKLLKAFYE